MTGADLPQRAVERGLKPLIAERLEEISDCLRLERAQRVLVMGGHEYDFRHHHVWRIAHEGGKHAEAVELRHLDVEEHQLHGSAVAGAGADGLERFGAAGAASHQLHAVVARQQPAQPLATWFLVIHDQRANGLHVGRY